MQKHTCVLALVLFALPLAATGVTSNYFTLVNSGPSGTTINLDSNLQANVLRFLNPNEAGCSAVISGGSYSYCADSNYVSPFNSGNGAVNVYDQGNNADPLVGLILQATFDPDNLGTLSSGGRWQGNIGGVGGVSFDLGLSDLQGPGARWQGGGGANTAITNQYNQGYFAYLYLNMANFQNANVPGLPAISAYSPPTALQYHETVSLAYSFTNLPAQVIFNVYGVRSCSAGTGTCVFVDYTNPNSSTYGHGGGGGGGCTGPGCGGGGGEVPEPATLVLLSTGLGLMIRRFRQA